MYFQKKHTFCLFCWEKHTPIATSSNFAYMDATLVNFADKDVTRTINFF